jgi:hypothetical protein
MPQIIEIPSVGQVEFPDGMSDTDIAQAIQRNYPPTPSLSPLAMGAARQKAELEAAANDPSMVGSFLRNARENLGAGVGGALAGAASGAATGAGLGAMGLNPLTVGIGTIGGGLVGGVAGAFGGQKIQSAIDPITDERQAAIARDMEVNPISSFAGQVAPALITGRPSIANIGRGMTPLSRAGTAAERAAIINSRINVGSEVAIGGAFDVGQALATGQDMDPRQIALNAAAGGLFSNPNRLGRALGQGPMIIPPVEAAPQVAPMQGDGMVMPELQPLPVEAAVPAPLPIQPLPVEQPVALPVAAQQGVERLLDTTPLPADASAAPVSRTRTLGPEETGIAPVALENAGTPLVDNQSQPDVPNPQRPAAVQTPEAPQLPMRSVPVGETAPTVLEPDGGIPKAPEAPEAKAEDAVSYSGKIKTEYEKGLAIGSVEALNATGVTEAMSGRMLSENIRKANSASKKAIEVSKDYTIPAYWHGWTQGRVKAKSPVGVEAVDAYGIKLPDGYVKQGDLYVYQPATESRTTAPARPADTVGVERAADDFFGGTRPENVKVVSEPDGNWEARVKGDTIEVNSAKVGPEGVRSALHEEVGHVAFRNEAERAQFQKLYDALDAPTRQKIDDTVDRLYSDESPSVKAEERLVKALRAILDRTPEGRTLWQKLVQMARRAFKRITGQAAKDPEMIAAAILKRGMGKVKGGMADGPTRNSIAEAPAAEEATPTTSYRKALDAAKQEVADRADYKEQAKTVLAEIAKLPKAEQKPAKIRMYAELDEARIIGRGKDKQFKVEMPKVVQEMIAVGKSPTEADVIKALAAKFPEQKGYLRKNFERIYDEMVYATELAADGKDTPRRQYAEALLEHLREIRSGVKDGSTLRHVQRGLSLFRDTYFNGIGGKMQALAEGKFTGKESAALRRAVADIIGIRANQDGVNFEGIDGLAELDVKKMTNDRIKFDTDLDAYFKDQKMDTASRAAWLERVSDHVVDPSRDGELAREPKLKEAVDYFTKRRRERLTYLREAGVDVGDAGERSLSRSLNVEKVLSSPKEFLTKASQAYTRKWAREIAQLRKEEAIKAAEGKDTSKIKEEIRKLEKKDAQKAAEKYLYAITSDDNGISSDGNDITAAEGGGGPSFLKKREFGPEADELLGKFYHRNIAEMDTAETLSTVRAATKARVLSAPALDAKGNPRKDGKIDPVGKWKKLRAELEAEGNQDMIPIAAQLFKDYLNLNGSNNEAVRKLVGHLHTYTQLAYLSHATVASLGEATLIGVRTGNFADTARAYAQIAKGIVRALKGAGPDEIRILNRELGLVADSFDGLMSSHALSDAFGGRGAGGKLVTRFHRLTGLSGWTNLTFDAATRIGKSFISSQVKLVKNGGSMSRLAMREMNELGISRADLDVLDSFITKLDKTTDQNSLILGDEPGADLYRKALSMFHKTGAALNPTRATRAQKANNPVAGMFYQLQSFLYDFHQKVTLRQARRLKDAYRGTVEIDGKTENLSTAERTKVGTDALKAAAAIYGVQYGIQMLREKLFVDPERLKRDEEKSSTEINVARALGAASRTGILGPYDTLFNVISGARYQREPATVVLGPAVGGMSELFQSVANLYGDRNSGNTNTTERKLARTAYNTLATPAMNAVFAGAPSAPLAAALIQAARHPLTRERVVKGVAGPIQTGKKPKPPMTTYY